MTRHLASLLVLVALMACSREATSEVHLIVNADDIVRQQTISLRVVLAGRPAGGDIWEEAPPRIFDQSTPVWPRELTFPPKGNDTTREFSVKATALDNNDTTLVIARAFGHFTSGKSELRIQLTADCLTTLVTCSTDQTCRDGQCTDARLTPDAGIPVVDASTIQDANPTRDANNSHDAGSDACVPVAVYRDDDGDDFGLASSRLMTCTPVDGYVEQEGDCNDTSNSIRPGTTELCDGIDNNCDMRTDEGCACTTGTTRACGTDTGECTVGTETCRSGSWIGCSATLSATEVCDGRDNDCDGTSDDSATCPWRTHSPGTCTSGSCRYTCTAGYGDCDGESDNGCETDLNSIYDCGRCRNRCLGRCDDGICTCGSTGTACDDGSDSTCCTGLICNDFSLTCTSCASSGERCYYSDDCCDGYICDATRNRCVAK